MGEAVISRVALACHGPLHGHSELQTQIQDFLLPLAILGPAFAQRVGGARLLHIWLRVATTHHVPLREYTAAALYGAARRHGAAFAGRLMREPRLPDAVLFEVVGLAVADDARELLSFLKNETKISPPARVTYDVAAAHGNLDLLKWLQENRFEQSSTLKALAAAAQRGSLETIEWLARQGLTVDAVRWMMDKAALHGHLHVVQWLCDNSPPMSWSNLAVGIAVKNDHLQIADFLIKKCHSTDGEHMLSPPALGTTLAALCSSGDLCKLKWLHERGLLLTNLKRKHIEMAKTHGRLSILQFLTDQFPGHFDSMMGFTGQNAEGGSIEVAEWADAQGKLERSLSCVYSAAQRGHIDFIRWFVSKMDGKNMQFFPDYMAVPVAASGGHLASVQFLVETGWGEVSVFAIEGAAAKGHTQVLRWLLGNTHVASASLSTSMKLAAANGHLETVQHLFLNAINADVGAVVPAASNGHFEVVWWLVQQFPRSEYNEIALAAAVSEGHLRVVRLFPSLNKSNRNDLVALARENDHEHVAKWIEQYR